MRIPLYRKILLLLFLMPLSTNAQDIMSRKINIEASGQPLSQVLEQIAKKGNFRFSYSGLVIPRDSVVSISANQATVSVLLSRLILRKPEYLESGDFLIIRPRQKSISMITSDMVSNGNQFSLSGIVIDPSSGERIKNASVYEKRQLLSTLSDEHGYFRLRLRNEANQSTGITISKQGYRDTTLYFLQTVSIFENKVNNGDQNEFNRGEVEGTALGNALISARKKLQSLNITSFFANRPFQISLAPEVSSRGMMAPQVLNNFSLNLTGGYTGGVNGVEIAGIFNINKKDVHYLQFAGIFNLTGGAVSGVQVSGANNRTFGDVRGLQLSGFLNSTEGTLKGLQVSALNNYAAKLKGVQIGLVNVADSSSGLSIGLLNIIRNGFYSLSLSATREMNTILTLKTGTRRLYTAVILGNNISSSKKQYAFGLGLGSQLPLIGPLSADLEFDYLFANEGSWDDRWLRLHSSLRFAFSKNFSLFAGPVYNKYRTDKTQQQEGYQNLAGLPESSGPLNFGSKTKEWLGWQAGLTFTGAFAPLPPKIPSADANWELEFGLSAGRTQDDPRIMSGAEASVKKNFDGSFYGIFTTAYMHLFKKNSTYYISTPWISRSVDFIPLKAGVRKMIGPKVYVGGDLGYVFALNTQEYPASGSFLYGAYLGYKLSSPLALQFRFEDFRRFTFAKTLALKLAYKLPLGK